MSRAPLTLVRKDDELGLLDVFQAAQRLATVKSIVEAREVRDRAKAWAVYQRMRGSSLEAQNDAAEIALWAERRMGEILREQPKAEGTRNRGIAPSKAGVLGGTRGAPPTLEERGITKKEAARWQQLASVPIDRFTLHIASVRERAQRLTTSGVIAARSHGAAYDSDEFYTPSEYVEAGRGVLGEIDLDPASNAKAQRIVAAKTFWTKRDDGLSPRRKWFGRVWMNPPYSQPLCNQFVLRLLESYERGDVVAAIVLLNASTDTTWFHALAEAGLVCLTSGRIAFLDPDGNEANGNRVGQAFFCLGDREVHARFRSVFTGYGVVGKLEGDRTARARLGTGRALVDVLGGAA